MSSNNVDNRVVNMQFNNAQFEAGVKQTIASLDELKKSLKFNTSLTGINAVSNAINTFNLSNVASNVDLLASKFTTFGQIGQNVISNLTNSAIQFGKNIYNSTLGVITSGGWGRASRSAQARFTLEGILGTDEQGLARVEKAFESARESVNDTAYTLDAAVSAASQLVASGVDEGEELQKVLSGVAGVAATTGQSYEGLAHIWTTVAGNGRLMGMQLTQLSSYGLNAAKTLADYLNTTETEIRDMVSKGEISFETFSNAMAETFGAHAKDANKTFSGVTANIRAQLTKIGEIFASGIIENDDLIDFLNDFMKKLKEIKNYVEKLKEPFKKLISTISKLASYWLSFIDITGIDKFIGYIETGINYLNDFLSKYIGVAETIEDEVTNSALGEMVSQMTDAAEKLEKAKDIWFAGKYGNGQARKDALGEQYDDVQSLVNAFYESGYSWEAVEEMIASSSTEASKEVVDANENTKDSIEEVETEYKGFTSIINGLFNAFSKFGKGIKTIFNNAKMTVVKLGKTFKKVFSWKDLIEDISDYGELFSKFVGYFELTKDRSEKLENSFSGLWSAVDLLRKGIKLLVTAGVNILGPALSVAFDIILTITSAIGKAITKFNEWTEKHQGLTNTVKKFSEMLGKAITTVAEFFEKLWNLPAVQEIRAALWDLATLVYDNLKPYFEKAGEAIEDFFKKFNSSGEDGTMEKVLTKINEALEKVIKYSGDAKTAIGDFTKWVGDGISDLLGFQEGTEDAEYNLSKIKKTGEKIANSKSLGEFITNLTDSVSRFGDTVDKVVSWVIKKFNSLDATRLAAVGFGSSLVMVGMSFAYLSYNLGVFFKAFAGVGDAIKSTVSGIKEIFSSISSYIKNESRANLIKSIALAIAVLAASLVALTFVDQDKLTNASKCLLSLIGVISILAIVFVVVSAVVKDFAAFGANIRNISIFMIALAAAVFILANALVELDKYKFDSKDWWKPIATMVGMFVALGVMAGVMSKFVPQITTGVIGLVAIAGAIWIMSKALLELNKLDTKGIEEKIKALRDVVAILTVAIIAIKKLGSGSGTVNVLGVLGMIAAIWLIELALIDIIEYGVTMQEIKDNLDKFIPVLASLAIIVTAVSILGALCKGASSMAGTILAFSIGVLILVYAIKKLSDISKTGDLATGLIALTGIFVLFAVLLYAVGKVANVAEGIGKELLYIAVAIGILSFIAYALGKVNFAEFIKGSLLMGGVILMVGLLAKVTKMAKEIDYKSLYAMVVAVGILTVAIVVLSFIEDKLSLLYAAGILGVAFISLGASLMLAGKYADKISVKSILAMIFMITLISSALYLLATDNGGSWANVVAAAAALGVALLAVGVAMYMMGKAFQETSITKNRMIMVAEMIVMVGVIAASLSLLIHSMNGDTSALGAAVIGIIALIATVVIALSVLTPLMKGSKIDNSVMVTIGVMIAGLIAASFALSLLVKSMNGDTTTLVPAVVAIASLMVIVVVMIAAINKQSNQISGKGIAVLIIAIAGLCAIAAALRYLFEGDIDWNQAQASIKPMMAVLFAIMATMTILTIAASAFSWVGVVAMLVAFVGVCVLLVVLGQSMKNIATAIKIMVEALNALTTVEFEKLEGHIGTLWQLVAIVLALSVTSFVLGAGLVVVGIGLAAVGAGALVVVTAVALLAATVITVALVTTKFIDALNNLVTTFKESKGAISSGIGEIGTGLANAITNFITNLAIKAPIIKKSLLTIVETGIEVITEGINKINTVILDGIIEFLTTLEIKLPIIIQKINNIIITLLKSLASNAQTYGYYGAVISVSFLYGLSQGIVEMAPAIGETVANVIVSLFAIASSLIETLMPSVTDTVRGVGLNVSEALWGVLAETTGSEWVEQQYETVLGEQQQFAAEKADKIANAESQAYVSTMTNNTSEMKDATNQAVNEATDQSDVADANGAKTTGSFFEGAASHIPEGVKSYTGDLEGMLKEYTPTGNGYGIDFTDQFVEGANSEVKEQSIDISNLPTEAVAQMKKEGWTLEEGGKTMTKSIQTGIDNSTLDFTANYDVSESQLLDAVDGTNDELGEKGTEGGENYGAGFGDGIGNKLEYVKEKAREMAQSAIDEAEATLDEHSPSKEGNRIGAFFSMGVGNGISELAGYVTSTASDMAGKAITAAGEMMQSINSILTTDEIDWQPTITPVIDGAQLQNGSNVLTNTFGDSALNMAANASLSVNNASQNTLAQQVQNLSDQVKKLAETDYSELLSGVNVNVDASTNVDGTTLRKTSAAYTIQQIDDQQRSYSLAMGGRA